jgi:predicted AlkP superfamily phosphohydrolase/phosphomutase
MTTKQDRSRMARRRFLQIAAAMGFSLRMKTSSRTNAAADDRPAEPRFARCLVLGMDGLDPQLTAALMRENKLPHFARLAHEGTFGPLQTSNPVMSPVAWSSIATGAGPGTHGIFDFLHRDPRNYTPYLSLRKSSSGFFGMRYEPPRRCDGFWRYTSDAGLPTTVVRWPVTFPPEKVNGRFLSGLGVPDLLGTEGQYTFYTTVPVPADDPSPHNVVPVTWEPAEPGTVRTVLRGPMVGRGRTTRVPLIARSIAAEACRVQIGDAPAVDVRRGQWTPWIKITFKAGLTRIHGMVKLLPRETGSQLQLFASPIHLDPAHPAFGISCPADYARSLAERVGTFHTLGMPEMVHPLSHGRYGFDEFLAQVQEIRTERREMFRAELERFDRGVLAFVFDHTDRIQHAFWATRDPGHPRYDAAEAQSYRHVIDETYQEMDACLGEALARIDNRTLLLAVSDHGFGSFRRQVHLNRWLVDNGFMRLQGPRDAEGRGLFQDVDWSHTKAYAVGFSSIYLNRVGREAGGSVPPGAPARDLLQEIAGRLGNLVDPRTGARVVHEVYPGRQLYGAGPLADQAPDLVVGFAPGYRASWQTALGGAPARTLEDNRSRWSGDHIFDPDLMPGVLLSNAKLRGPSRRGIDIAPTLLAACGLPQPVQITGQDLLGPDLRD